VWLAQKSEVISRRHWRKTTTYPNKSMVLIDRSAFKNDVEAVKAPCKRNIRTCKKWRSG
jgi:hypothetical protein